MLQKKLFCMVTKVMTLQKTSFFWGGGVHFCTLNIIFEFHLTQFWISWGCSTGTSRPIPMFRGNFSQNPYLGIFLKKKVPIFCDFATKTHQIFWGENKTHSYGFFREKWDLCLGISCKKPTQNCGTSPVCLNM